MQYWDLFNINLKTVQYLINNDMIISKNDVQLLVKNEYYYIFDSLFRKFTNITLSECELSCYIYIKHICKCSKIFHFSFAYHYKQYDILKHDIDTHNYWEVIEGRRNIIDKEILDIFLTTYEEFYNSNSNNYMNICYLLDEVIKDGNFDLTKYIIEYVYNNKKDNFVKIMKFDDYLKLSIKYKSFEITRYLLTSDYIPISSNTKLCC